jgi:predicted kinase
MVVRKKNNLVVILLVGIPCSGKTTWVEDNTHRLYDKYDAPVVVISKDEIREELGGKDYRWTPEFEKKVVEKYYKLLSTAINLDEAVIVLDNTHVKPKEIDLYLSIFRSMMYNGTLKMRIKFFDIPFHQAKLRNFARRNKTGKFIPDEVMQAMQRYYTAIDKSKYKRYIYEDE